MTSATSKPAGSAAGHYMEGRGYGLIVFASVLLSSRGEPGAVGYERNTVTIAQVAKVIPARGVSRCSGLQLEVIGTCGGEVRS